MKILKGFSAIFLNSNDAFYHHILNSVPEILVQKKRYEEHQQKAQLVKRLTLDFSSSHYLRVLGLSPGSSSMLSGEPA